MFEKPTRFITIKSCKWDIVSVIPAISVQIYRLWARLGCVMMVHSLYLKEVLTKTFFEEIRRGPSFSVTQKYSELLFSKGNSVM